MADNASTSDANISDAPKLNRQWSTWRSPPKKKSLSSSIHASFPRPPSISFRTSSLSREMSGEPIATLGNDSLWPLTADTEYERRWQKLEPQLKSIVRETSSDTGSSPAVLLQGYFVGKSRKETQPSVVISSSSQSYAKRLKKTLQRSGVLCSGQESFQVKIRQPGVMVSYG